MAEKKPLKFGDDDYAARELMLTAENDHRLYNQYLSIIENLKKKSKKGIYDPDAAIRLWRYWIDNANKIYKQEFGDSFDVPTRNLAAKMIEEQERYEIENAYAENPVKKKSAPKKKAVSRPSQATGKKPSKRLVERRKKTAKAPAGYFANPIVGEKAAPFYVAFVEHDGDRYYYGGSKTDGTPLFDSDIEKAFLSHESKPLARHVKIEAMQHIRGKGLKLKVIRAYIDKTGRTIPGE